MNNELLARMPDSSRCYGKQGIILEWPYMYFEKLHHTGGNVGVELNLLDWQFWNQTTKLKSGNVYCRCAKSCYFVHVVWKPCSTVKEVVVGATWPTSVNESDIISTAMKQRCSWTPVRKTASLRLLGVQRSLDMWCHQIQFLLEDCSIIHVAFVDGWSYLCDE